jgi:hypothetical protein
MEGGREFYRRRKNLNTRGKTRTVTHSTAADAGRRGVARGRGQVVRLSQAPKSRGGKINILSKNILIFLSRSLRC